MQQHAPMAAAAAQQLALQNSLLVQRQRQNAEGMKGQCLLKLMLFSEHLSGFPVRWYCDSIMTLI